MNNIATYILILIMAGSLAMNYKLHNRINTLEANTPKILTMDYAKVLTEMSTGLDANVDANAEIIKNTLNELKSMGYVVIDSRMVFASSELATLSSESFTAQSD